MAAKKTVKKKVARKSAGSKPVAPVARERKTAPEIPAILFEGDGSESSLPTGPGQRYVAVGPAGMSMVEEGVLPEAYGTEKLTITARDPYWVFARWDLTRDQMRRYNGLSKDRHLVLRMYRDALGGEPVSETHVHPESRSWFVNVNATGTVYVGELGYYEVEGAWKRIAVSGSTKTPSDQVSDDTSETFETLPSDLEFSRLVELVRGAAQHHLPLVEAVQQLRAEGMEGLPDRAEIATGQWTEEQREALSEIVRKDSERRIWIGSLEVTELVKSQLRDSMSSGGVSGISSWGDAFSSDTEVPQEGDRSFWFNVNAELIIYGSTEADAKVTIAGRPIRLRPDGSFSFRFALPDGQYDLEARAESGDGVEARTASMNFGRSTAYEGDVGAHAQDPALKSPTDAELG